MTARTAASPGGPTAGPTARYRRVPGRRNLYPFVRNRVVSEVPTSTVVDGPYLPSVVETFVAGCGGTGPSGGQRPDHLPWDGPWQEAATRGTREPVFAGRRRAEWPLIGQAVLVHTHRRVGRYELAR